jgi:cyanate lyase
MAAATRAEATAAILSARRRKGLSWADVAEVVGQSREWTTAACLGQMSFTPGQAAALTEALELPREMTELLTESPYRGSLPTQVPTDPLVYRFYELIAVYGTTFKELITEEFGDGIMSAIDFSMRIAREPDPAGDRVNITFSGKFLPYKRY